MQEYIDSDKFSFVYSNLPGETADYLQKYIMKVINFFKSYKIDMIGMNTIYTLDDEFENLVRAIDKIDHIDITLFKSDTAIPSEKTQTTVTTGYKDRVQPLEELYITYIRTLIKLLDDRYNIKDDYIITGEFPFEERCNINEVMTFKSYFID